jgi:uncharacterized pyridoxal phosphate-containing UPF0001 family protein
VENIKINVQVILKELPPGVQLVVAGKGRTVPELKAAIEGGAYIIGENYVQEAQEAFSAIGSAVQWHFIGHLQKNKIKSAVGIFDIVETVDSLDLVRAIDRRAAQISKIIPVLIEVNSGSEDNKSGALPQDIIKLAHEISLLANISLMGLMTLGPAVANPQG